MQSLLKTYANKIRELDPQGSVIYQLAPDLSNHTVKIRVTSAWHSQPYQSRLQMAQNLWKLWVSVRTPAEPDRAYIKIEDLNGNKIGGSVGKLSGHRKQ